MNPATCSGLVLATLALSAPAWPDAKTVAAPQLQEVARGVWLVPGAILPDRQPDGNTVVFAAPDGLIVVDTGRHSWHSDAILSLARAQQAGIIAIVNTHWHLDHVSGNPTLRKAYPGLRAYASDADVWVYDEQSRVVALGDLVTLPAPFLDTACPEGWQDALQLVAATPFEQAIPGHGLAMTRTGFQLYREAFEAFIACSTSARSADECASGWADSVRTLLAEEPLERQRALQMAAYYVGMLRANGGRSKYCESVPGL